MAVTATKVNGQFQFSGRAINITQAKNKALEPYNCIVHDYGITLELRGDGDCARVAIWTRDGYTFSITTNADLTPEAMTAMAESVA